jgi:hypothetical protein
MTRTTAKRKIDLSNDITDDHFYLSTSESEDDESDEPKEVPPNNSQVKKLPQHEASWWSQVPSMLNDEATSDLVIVVGDERIHAHKMILSLHSSVFKAMFQNDMRESANNELHITDCSANAVMCFLRSLYDSSTVEIDSNLLELFALAEKYGVESIKSVVKQHIGGSMNESNVIEVIKFAQLYDLDEVQSRAFKFYLDMLPVPVDMSVVGSQLDTTLVGKLIDHLRTVNTLFVTTMKITNISRTL